MPARRSFTISQMLRWADEHQRRTGRYPTNQSGRIHGEHHSWGAVAHYLHKWSEPGQANSIAQLLQAHRGKRNTKRLPNLSIAQVLRWADAHFRRMGQWPIGKTIPIPESGGETWKGIDEALRLGRRGFRPHQTLARLLQKNRDVRNRRNLSPLTISQVLNWCDADHARTGRWPTSQSGAVQGAPGETWAGVNHALQRGRRGIRPPITLVALLNKQGRRRKKKPTKASDQDILRWVREHRRRTGRWPHQRGGLVRGTSFTWSGVDSLVRRRSISAGRPSTLSTFLSARMGKPLRRRGPLVLAKVTAWAEAHRRRSGHWPSRMSGPIPEAPGETWHHVYDAARRGQRGLPRMAWFSSRRKRLPRKPLSEQRIIAWARAYRRRTGRWPAARNESITEAPSETWRRINDSLSAGTRGLPGGASLARFLADRCGARTTAALPPRSIGQILTWADEHRERTGRWPVISSGPIRGIPGETWSTIAYALKQGQRGLPPSSLGDLLEMERGVRPHRWGGMLSETQITSWARAHHERTGVWPHANGGLVFEAPDRTWRSIDHALRLGSRGLKGGTSLARLLARKVGARNPLDPPRLSVRKILGWADAHYRRRGTWPASDGGPVIDAPGEHWSRIHEFLKRGGRGLLGGSSLVSLLTKARGARYRHQGVPLSIERILDWAQVHHRRTGQWPTADSGPVRNAKGEHWRAIDAALRAGSRNLRGGSSLQRLLKSRFDLATPAIASRRKRV